MIFVDTNLFMYAVGRPHPLQPEARLFIADALQKGDVLVTSSEVMQELLHAYIPVARMDTLEAAFHLIEARMQEVWPLEAADVRLARMLSGTYPELNARDLVHLACCQRRSVTRLKTFDRALEAAAKKAL